MKWVLKILRKHGLADGQSVCIDATTLQANASMKSLVRRDTGQAYEDYLRQLAQSEGIEMRVKSSWRGWIVSARRRRPMTTGPIPTTRRRALPG